MRFSGIVPILLAIAALVLSFLSLFAGTRTNFLPEYGIVTLNTSQIGQGVLNSSFANSNPIVSSILSEIPDSIRSDIEDAVTSLASRLGVHDFYSAYPMSYCEGFYTPTAVPNATVSAGDIGKNFTLCSNTTAFFQFDPRDILQRELNETGHSNINLSDLNWPSQVDDGIAALHTAQKAVFILYCIAIGLIGISLLVAAVSFFLSGRLSACLNVLITLVAFLAIGIASALVTVIAVKARDAINQYGAQVGISASVGTKFLGLTWGATAAMLICVVWWSFDCIVGRRNRRRGGHSEKTGY